MELFGIGITLLAGVLTYLAWWNGRWMKQTHRDSMELLVRIDKGQEEARKEMADARRQMAEALKQLGDAQQESRREMADTMKHLADLQQEARREMADAIRYLGNLIVAEGEKTRQALKT